MTLLTGRLLDIGSGSGLSSLAAKRGATVLFLISMKHQLNTLLMMIVGSFNIDVRYLETLGVFDIVYSVYSITLVRCGRPDGLFFIAIYNDRGFKSHFWWMVKYFYTNLPRF